MCKQRQMQIKSCPLGELEKFILITFLHLDKPADIATATDALKNLCTTESYKLYIVKTTMHTVIMRLVKKKLLKEDITLSRLKTFRITEKGKEELKVAMHNTLQLTEVYKKTMEK